MGVSTATPAASAVFEVKSTTQGLLLPRLTAVQRDAIVGPVAVLLVFQTNATVGLYFYTGFDWINLTTGLKPDAAGNAGPNPATQVSTLAGSGASGSANGTGAAAQFNFPSGVAADGSGNVYVADRYNNRTRRVVVATGAVTTLAGSGVAGFADGIAVVAQFFLPLGVGLDGAGNVYVADQGNHRIRVVKP